MVLIKQIELPNGQHTTNLGFGCSGLLRLPTLRQRESLLKTAIEMGLTHFDVARMYGMGAAEGVLGSVIHPVRDRVTIATKFGLPFQSHTGPALQIRSLARSLFNLSPSLKRRLKKVAAKPASSDPSPQPQKNYSVQEMEQSLRSSLQQLQTDHVDLFFVHEPSIRDSIAEDLAVALRERKASGEIGAYGISCGRLEAAHFLKAQPELCQDAIQHSFSVFDGGSGSPAIQRPFTGVFGVLSADFHPLEHYLAKNESFGRVWSSQLGFDLFNRENVGIVILAMALLLNPEGMVLFFTSKPERLRRIVKRLTENTFSSEGLLAFRAAAAKVIYAN